MAGNRASCIVGPFEKQGLPIGGVVRMREEYYKHVLENRRVVADPENLKCTCTRTLCEWHGR